MLCQWWLFNTILLVISSCNFNQSISVMLTRRTRVKVRRSTEDTEKYREQWLQLQALQTINIYQRHYIWPSCLSADLQLNNADTDLSFLHLNNIGLHNNAVHTLQTKQLELRFFFLSWTHIQWYFNRSDIWRPFYLLEECNSTVLTLSQSMAAECLQTIESAIFASGNMQHNP